MIDSSYCVFAPKSSSRKIFFNLTFSDFRQDCQKVYLLKSTFNVKNITLFFSLKKSFGTTYRKVSKSQMKKQQQFSRGTSDFRVAPKMGRYRIRQGMQVEDGRKTQDVIYGHPQNKLAKIYPQLTLVFKTPPLRSHYYVDEEFVTSFIPASKNDSYK